MLSWLERKAAAAFFGSPPTSTVEEALDQFMQVGSLKNKQPESQSGIIFDSPENVQWCECFLIVWLTPLAHLK